MGADSDPELIAVMGSQSAGEQSHELGGRLPLLSASRWLSFLPYSVTALVLIPTYTA